MVSLICRMAMLALGVTAVCAHSRAADDSPRDRVAALVEALASRNQPPKLPDFNMAIERPQGYDRQAQEHVYDAWDKLFALGVTAFPVLIEHFDDERYSVTEDRGVVWRNYSVGGVCRSIIEQHLQVHWRYARSQEEDKPPPSYVWEVLWTTKEAQQWWKTRDQKKLWELQVEVLQWAIAKEKARGFKDLWEEADILGPLEHLQRQLQADRKPIAQPSRPDCRVLK